jgi:pseudaminic acid biosynthesis-associated methylase
MQKESKLSKPELQRLEALWMGEFGDAYVDRNTTDGTPQLPFWREVFTEFPIENVLEVGCNLGVNLRAITKLIEQHQIYGIDINRKALNLAREALPDANLLWSRARELPFRDQMFDLVFTIGVLIHQPPELLPQVMAEIVRSSRRYILCGEYHAEEPTEVNYRHVPGALFKQDYGALYQKLFPELRLIKSGFLSQETGGWDDITYWIFERP